MGLKWRPTNLMGPWVRAYACYGGIKEMDLRLEMGLKWRLTIFNKPTELGYTLVMLVEGKTVGRWAFNVD